MLDPLNPPPPPVVRPAWRHPAMIALSIAFLAAVVSLKLEVPWLVGASLVFDLLLVMGGLAMAVRQSLRADAQTSRAEQISAEARLALAQSEARLAAIVDSAMDAIITVDRNQQILLFNRAAEQMFKCSRESAIGSPLDRFIPARFRNAHRGHIDQFGRTGVTNRRMGEDNMLWAMRSDDDEFPIEASISQSVQGAQRYYTVILRDVTRRKEFEDALKRQRGELRALSAQVQEAREEEKTRIARELHDELGQLLTALKMDMGWLRERLPAGDSELAAKTGRMTETLDQTVTSIRRIAADLRPLMLDDLGLGDAVAWLVEDFSQRSGVNCRLQAAGTDALDGIDRALANTVYRALQESLTNIGRHAEAANAWILLALDADQIRLEIEDDGRGITAEDLAKARSLGLKGMRERVLHVGGQLEISRAPRGGTRLSLRVPLVAREAADA
jgi:two-component system, NarL family, sensor histidine kinase UhpB